MHATAPQPLFQRRCRMCHQPLTALQQRRGDLCDTLDCRRKAAAQAARRASETTLAARRDSAARHWDAPALAEAPVFWMERHATRLVPLPAALRQRQREHLQQLVQQLGAEPGPPAHLPELPDASTPLAGALCAFCSGRCCRYGAGSHGFVSTELLRRWLAQHPGSTPEQAAAAYLERLPSHHVEFSCVHHGRQGCTLPAEMRSDICNRYACDTLRQLQDAEGCDNALAAMQRDAVLADAAWLQPAGFRRLPRRGGPRPR